MISDFDKERLRAKYEAFCHKNGFASDIFDFDAELDCSLDFWEAWGNIEDKLESVKSMLIVKAGNNTSGSDDIEPQTIEQVKEWLLKRELADEMENIFPNEIQN